VVDEKKNSMDRLLAVGSLALAAALVASNRWFLVVDDECAIIDRATLPAAETLRLYTHGIGEHEHPPLYDLILHGWLRISSGEMNLLRVPSILFYALAAFILAKASERLGGKRAQVSVFCIVAFWPFGFHFGRLACWYSFSFLAVSLLTLAYLNFMEQSTRRNWLWVLLCGVALIYTSYFGWAILGCLAVDFLYRRRASIRNVLWPLLGTGLLLFIANLPLLRAFLHELHGGVKQSHSILSILLLGAYNLYCLIVSESVAPWFWFLGIPAATAIGVCLLLIFFYGQPEASRFLLYFAGLLTVMTILGIVETKRTLLIGAWLVLPIGVAIGTLKQNLVRRVIFASFALAIAFGWYGMFYRKLYAAPHWNEPWPAIANEAAATVRRGGVVVGNNSSFFFYLTYFLMPRDAVGSSRFHGLLPTTAIYPGVYNPEQWIAAGRPMEASTLVVKGLSFPKPPTEIEQAKQWLEGRCLEQNVERFAHDQGAIWKQRYMPAIPQPEWRIELIRFSCP
jgi:hypothetical protein